MPFHSFSEQMEQGDYSAALETIRAELVTDPSNGHYHSLLALALLRLNRHYAARNEARLGLQMACESAFGVYVLGLAERANHNYKTAIKALRQAISLDPKNADYHAELGETYIAAGQTVPAKQAMEKALQFDSHHAKALAGLGDFYCSINDNEKAEVYYHKALNTAPQNPVALLGVAQFALVNEDFDAVRKAAICVLKQDYCNLKALQLMSKVKTRTSLLKGGGWRLNSRLYAWGLLRRLAIALVIVVLSQFLTTLLHNADLKWPDIVITATLVGAFFYISFVPDWFIKSVQDELQIE